VSVSDKVRFGTVPGLELMPVLPRASRPLVTFTLLGWADRVERLRADMGILRRMDRRREGRSEVDLALMVWGVDTKGERFLQEARARDISLSGALLTGLDADLRSGDVVGILCGKRKARFRVVWVRYDETGDKMQVAVHRVDPDECPWLELLSSEEPAPREDDEASAEL